MKTFYAIDLDRRIEANISREQQFALSRIRPGRSVPVFSEACVGTYDVRGEKGEALVLTVRARWCAPQVEAATTIHGRTFVQTRCRFGRFAVPAWHGVAP